MVAAAGAVAVGLALATAGPGLGFANDENGSSTRGVQPAKPAPAGTGLVPATTNIQPPQGVKPSSVIPQGSTRDMAPPASSKDSNGEQARVIDTTDKGVKNLPATKDLGKKDAPVRTDRGDR